MKSKKVKDGGEEQWPRRREERRWLKDISPITTIITTITHPSSILQNSTHTYDSHSFPLSHRAKVIVSLLRHSLIVMRHRKEKEKKKKEKEKEEKERDLGCHADLNETRVSMMVMVKCGTRR